LLTSLDDIDTDIIYASFDLLGNKIGGNDMNALDALSVLRSEGRSGGHGIAAMGSDDFLVSLKSTEANSCQYSNIIFVS
jgi:hypothetical protein